MSQDPAAPGAVSVPRTEATTRRWLVLAVLALGSGTIYKLATLRDVFYVPMQRDMGLSHAEIGLLTSANAAVAALMFVLGGALADRFPARALLPCGLLASGFVGLMMSAFPAYEGMLGLFALLAVFADGVFWPALLKTIRGLGGPSEQGRLFGFLEGGRGFVDTIVAAAALGLFVWVGEGSTGLRSAILLYALLDIAVGIGIFLLLREHRPEDAPTGIAPHWLTGLRLALRLPALWLLSLHVFLVYVAYCGLVYFVPYLRDVHGLPAALTGLYGIVNVYGLRMFGGPLGGYLADRIARSAVRYALWAETALLPLLLALLWLTGRESHIAIAMAITLLVALLVFTLRGVFWAPMTELGIPQELAGSAFGIGCLVGYSPAIFAFAFYGSILDALPGEAGYRAVFALMIAALLAAMLASRALCRIVERRRAGAQA